MKFERGKDMAPIKQEIICYLFDFVSRKTWDRWWHYKGEFKFEGKDYDLECDCKWDNQMFTYKNMHISHKQIVLDVEEVLSMEASDIAKLRQ